MPAAKPFAGSQDSSPAARWRQCKRRVAGEAMRQRDRTRFGVEGRIESIKESILEVVLDSGAVISASVFDAIISSADQTAMAVIPSRVRDGFGEPPATYAGKRFGR